jgi:hypothetical protein
MCDVRSPIQFRGSDDPTVIGRYPMLDEKASLEVLSAVCLCECLCLCLCVCVCVYLSL